MLHMYGGGVGAVQFLGLRKPFAYCKYIENAGDCQVDIGNKKKVAAGV